MFQQLNLLPVPTVYDDVALPLRLSGGRVRRQPTTAAAVEAFATRVLGKTVVHSQDRAGFVVNSLQGRGDPSAQPGLAPHLGAARMTVSTWAAVGGPRTDGFSPPRGSAHGRGLGGPVRESGRQVRPPPSSVPTG